MGILTWSRHLKVTMATEHMPVTGNGTMATDRGGNVKCCFKSCREIFKVNLTEMCVISTGNGTVTGMFSLSLSAVQG